MTVRVVTVIVCILDMIGWLLGAIAYFVSQSDQATAGFDEAAGVIITVTICYHRRARLRARADEQTTEDSLTLALAFPAIFAILFVAVIIAFT